MKLKEYLSKLDEVGRRAMLLGTAEAKELGKNFLVLESKMGIGLILYLNPFTEEIYDFYLSIPSSTSNARLKFLALFKDNEGKVKYIYQVLDEEYAVELLNSVESYHLANGELEDFLEFILTS
ncbi:hypothetical protein HS1genome_1012 [Sulfodiicoccus acidiphilus]|uniref:Uncharacterized protein n=1 Tax=Sulfodiicoccus acidiphilus TaxID=1670455 RepID=A0A348B371_9CREN|nr:hypothetical protein [Sulfodiicoccus acidiphilus]BBD72623.1 hypothetical protein HS1genome_1012 [Sulfodiicoccus acidiphilus]GGT93251.1 hypothetical protein GCM10007116_08640 [Sulfodiicoccus acidiphilus]